MRNRGTALRDGDVWPVADVDCRQPVLLEVAEAELVALRHFPEEAFRQSSAIVQAGGNCGLWPRMFARLGFTVHTFEPDATNMICLVQNCAAHLGEKVIPYMAALSNRIGWGTLTGAETNVGGYYLDPDAQHGERARLVTIDDVIGMNEPVALIQLDVEGAEVVALEGAQLTIGRCHPLLWLEDKGLTRRFGHDSAEGWLRETWPRYSVVDRVGRDILLAWN